MSSMNKSLRPILFAKDRFHLQGSFSLQALTNACQASWLLSALMIQGTSFMNSPNTLRFSVIAAVPVIALTTFPHVEALEFLKSNIKFKLL